MACSCEYTASLGYAPNAPCRSGHPYAGEMKRRSQAQALYPCRGRHALASARPQPRRHPQGSTKSWESPQNSQPHRLSCPASRRDRAPYIAQGCARSRDSVCRCYTRNVSSAPTRRHGRMNKSQWYCPPCHSPLAPVANQPLRHPSYACTRYTSRRQSALPADQDDTQPDSTLPALHAGWGYRHQNYGFHASHVY